MRSRRWLYACAAVLFALASSAGFALQGNGHGRDKHGDHDDDDRSGSVYTDHDRDAMRDWYAGHHDRLPPGLAERDQLPPGLERQLTVAQKTWNGGYRLRRQIANTSSSAVTSSC
jgi:hypothetical protein